MGSTPIHLADFEARLRDTPAAYQQYVTTPEGRRQFLNILVREKVLLVEARRASLQNDASYQKAIQQFKEKWKRELKDYQESLLIEMYLARLRAKNIAVTDDETQRYYQAHLTDFTKPVEIQASHILVNTVQDANKALARLKQGEPFETVAREMSMDPATASQGGKLTAFQRGSLVPEFEDAAFQLKNGETSGIVKSQFGYHIIKKASQRYLPSRSFEQVRDEIRQRLQREKFDRWVTQAQSALQVTVDEKAVAAYSPAARPRS